MATVLKYTSVLIPVFLGSMTAFAQTGDNNEPGAAMVACVSAPSRDCAFSSALQTAVAEELSIERARILVAVSESLLAVGERDQAIGSLGLAVEEARNVGIDFVAQEKIKDIAPLYAAAGDFDMALSLAENLAIRLTKERVLSLLVKEAYAAGNKAAVDRALGGFVNESRRFWERLNHAVHAPAEMIAALDRSALEAQVRGLKRPDHLYRGLSLIAALSHKIGDMETRDRLLTETADVLDLVASDMIRADILTLRLQAFHTVDMEDDAFQETYRRASILADRIRAREEKWRLSVRLGSVEAQTGWAQRALDRVATFDAIAEKAEYLATLDALPALSSIGETLASLQSELDDVEDRFERDRLRLLMIRAAAAGDARDTAMSIVRSMEDDDTQAQALALVAKIL